MNPGSQLCRRCVALLRRSPSVTTAGLTARRRFNSSLPSSSSSPSNLPLQKATAASPTKSTLRCASTQTSESPNNDIYVSSLGTASSDTSRELLKPNNLFHPFSSSPSPDIRRRAAYMRQHAFCPHPSHHRTRVPNGPADPESLKPNPGEAGAAEGVAPAHVHFDCPDCGLPVYCSEGHWMDDYESHVQICDTLRQINEDDHDLRSGRFFPEFEYPGHQRAEEFVLNMSNWDTFLYTRDFKAIDDLRSMRQVTRLMTYPTTIASVLHELSPYSIRNNGRLTNEGLRSFSALRYSLHPPLQGQDETMKGLRPAPPPIRIFVLGARAESSLPREVWLQLTHCFPRATFHIILVGPEAMANREDEFPLPAATPRNPFRRVVEDRLGGAMKITTYVEYWHTLHARGEFGVLDPFFDVFVLFHPGLGHPASAFEWRDTLPTLLASKCPVICTGYTPWDMERDWRWAVAQTNGAPGALNAGLLAGLAERAADDPAALAALRAKQETGEMDVLLEPGENVFRSLRWDLNDLDPSDVSCGNWGVWAFRGKRYETTHQDA